MKYLVPVLSLSAILLVLASPGQSQIASVTTWHNDPGRTGVNSQETTLNTSNVNSATFGKLYSLPVDGFIYAQPLYVPRVTIPGNGIHNVLYVATLNNSVYAFDADSSSGTPLWKTTFGVGRACSDFIGAGLCPATNGILSTPVIDTSRGVIYVVAETDVNSVVAFSLHSLDYTTGKEKTGSPVTISGSVAGTAPMDSLNGVVAFNPAQHIQRPALTELNGSIYIGFGSFNDVQPFHGWIFGYNGTTLRRTVVVCLTPNSSEGAVWQAGAAFSSDGNGNLYVQTGNGAFDGTTEWGEAVLRMNLLSGLTVTSYFAPDDEYWLSGRDQDLGASGTLVIPGTVMLPPKVVAGGKDGWLYLLDSTNLGGYDGSESLMTYNGTDHTVQEFQALNAGGSGTGLGQWGSNVFYNNTLYFWGAGDVLRSFAYNSANPSFSAGSTGTFAPYAGYAASPALSISADGLTPGTGIVWAWAPNGAPSAWDYPGVLQAYDASSLGTPLWSSDSNPSGADYAGTWSKWTPPTIANGRVYLATFDNEVNVFGLLPN